MPYFAIIKNSDDRRASQAAKPTTLRNCFVEAAPAGAERRSAFFIRPTPGRVRRTTLLANCRGLFCEPGSLNGRLYAVGGGVFSAIDAAWAVSTVATLSSDSDVVTMRAQRTKMVLRNGGLLYGYDGGTFAQLTHVNVPNPASTMTVVGTRVVAAFEVQDVFAWSAAGDYTTWPASGIAADIDQPDPIVGQEKVNGALCSLNASSVQFWEATSGAEDEAFVPMLGATFDDAGLFARALTADTRDGLIFVGAGKKGDRAIYEVAGIGVQLLPAPEIEQQMRDLTDDDLGDGVMWSYVDGTHEFVGFNFNQEVCLVHDRSLGLRHERTRFGATAYDVHFTARANGKIVVGGRTSFYLWSLEHDVFTDDGETIERIATLFVPSQGDVSVDRIVLDCDFRRQPMEGQGAAPKIILAVSLDGGENWDERVLDLPPLGQTGWRVQDFGFGLASAEHGVLIRLKLTDPIGFAWWGAWVNPSMEEVA